MPNYAQQLLEERETLSSAIETTIAAAAEGGKGLSDDDKKAIETRQARVTAIDGELTIIAAEQDSLRKANDFAQRFVRPQPRVEVREPERIETTGAAFVASDEFRSYGTNPRGKSGYFEQTDGVGGFETRAPSMTGGFPGSIRPDLITVPDAPDQFPLFGLVGMEQVSTGTFEYVRTVWDDNAAVVPEGQPKPESTITEQVTPGALDTIAHWTQVTRQALEDSSRIRSIIDGKLTNGVQKKVHDSITEVINATTLPTATDTALLAAIRKAIGQVQAEGWNPNAVLLNPADWAALDVDVMGGTLNGPMIHQSFWGLRPVASNAQPAGTAVVGDFKTGVTLFYRAGVGVYATDSHGDTFTSNVFTILAERRTKAAILNPLALCEATTGL